MDFTYKTYIELLKSILAKDAEVITLKDYINFHQCTKKNIVIIRHDIDRKPENALDIAKIESQLNIKASYYFRVVPESYNPIIMENISRLGHEIGYHYEDVDLVLKNNKELVKNKQNLIDEAYKSFCKNLSLFRKNFDVETVCMHGSPLSNYDNRIIWETYSYKDLGIICEPYFDLDYNKFAYFTDTGRRWNGDKISIRDKVSSIYDFNYKSTHDIIKNINNLPQKVIFNIHTERWDNRVFPWVKNLVFQKIKNLIKFAIIKLRKLN